MKTSRELLEEIGYEKEMLNNMSDADCDAEIQEIPYNV
jgi:hypothetical protein